MVYGWVVRCDIMASLALLFRATVAVHRVHEKADKGEAMPCKCHTRPFSSLHLQYEYGETQASFVSSLRDSYNLHNADASEKTSLKAIHGKEGPWLQRVTYEEYNGEDIDEKANREEQDKDDCFPVRS
jgi:hypothetical protein